MKRWKGVTKDYFGVKSSDIKNNGNMAYYFSPYLGKTQ